jgi:DNA polymerase-3 subunit beta
LANLLIKREENKILFISTDVEMQITTSYQSENSSSNLATTVGARKLVDILRAMPEALINLAINNKKMVIRSGKSAFALQTLPAEEFPIIQDQGHTESVTRSTLTQKNFKYLLSMTYFSMGNQDIRYYLNGMLLIAAHNKLTAVATDGHRLAYNVIDIPMLDGADEATLREVIIPRKTIMELYRLLEETDDPIDIIFSSNQVKFVFSNVEVLSKVVEGKFPDYQKVIPQNYQNSFLVNKTLLQAALQRAAILTSDKFKGIRFVIGNNKLEINSTNADQEEAKEEIEINYQGSVIDIGFNVTYLLDVLSNLKNEEIEFKLADSNSSALIMIPNDSSFKYVVMPMRI